MKGSKVRSSVELSPPVPSKSGPSKSSTKTSPSGTLTFVCEACGKKYTARNSSGLHVCSDCTATGSPKVKAKSPSGKPNAIICYVCGREFFAQSLRIHLPQCLKKRAVEQAKLPPEMRTTLPLTLEEMLAQLSNPQSKQEMNQTIEKINEEAFNVYKQNMVQCENCGRRFGGLDRLDIHLRSCRPGSTARPVGAVNARPQTTTAPPPASSYEPPPPQAQPKTAAKSNRASVTFQNPVAEPSPEEVPIKANNRMSTAPAVVQENDVDDDLVPCSNCGRRFAADRVAKHEKVCHASPLGAEPTPAPKTAPPAKPASKAANGASAKSVKWRSQHEQFQRAIKDARAVTKAMERGEMPPPPTAPVDHPDYIQCTFCGRKFAEEVADRHIAKCRNIVNRPAPPPKQVRLSETQKEYRARVSAQAQHLPVANVPSNRPATSSSSNVTYTGSTAAPASNQPKSRGSTPVNFMPNHQRAKTPSSNTYGGNPARATVKEGPAFCEGCGYKFTAAMSKFCGACGRKRP